MNWIYFSFYIQLKTEYELLFLEIISITISTSKWTCLTKRLTLQMKSSEINSCSYALLFLTCMLIVTIPSLNAWKNLKSHLMSQCTSNQKGMSVQHRVNVNRFLVFDDSEKFKNHKTFTFSWWVRYFSIKRWYQMVFIMHTQNNWVFEHIW